ncbi:methionyl-tRNA formyltransferase [Lacihabitans soyangensis]|uniref:Methionyl-tRNA formyltransferase n=1 Tax=Lacihabitans soyangensis TaxID=869394 RepID=A0AAE3H4N1_9BACT|nr:methionyl-tRNA formyltransferase [Lacihabitans soyangensis]MCP9764878.1 methionyl-tRNA formyltransferase [Lacihabitans soyangensis]
MRIIFMGTPDFAVATLQRLVENGFEVVAVITAPDKPVGRGQKMSESPVKKYALSQGIPVLQPEKLKNKAFLEKLATYKADLQVVVAFRMLPEAVWAMPKMGTINLHGSLLPQYRGAAPINWAVINGEIITGVTTFFIEKEIDTGNIIFSENIEIKETDTAGDLHDRMMWIGGDLMVKTVKAIASGVYPSVKQDFSQELKPAPKIFKETCKIDWQQEAKNIYDFVRGLSPYPAAWTILDGKVLKIFETEIVTDELPELDNFEFEGFTLKTDHKKSLFIQTIDGHLAIKSLQLEGKKRITTEEFLRGYRF